MDSGLYAAYTALLARTQTLELTANNLANANTAGFRASRETFGSVLAGIAGEPESQVGTATQRYGVLRAAHLSTQQGTIVATGNPLDAAIEGDGFFAVRTANGVRYTRNGSFERAQSGQLQTARGDALLSASGQPIIVPNGSVRIGADGSVSVDTPAGSAIAGRLGVFQLGADAGAAEGAGLYTATAATAMTSAVVHGGALEGANQDAVSGTVALLATSREAEMMQRALSVFHNDFDKTAADDLPRVSG